MASIFAILILLIFVFCETVDAQQNHSSRISLGSSLFPTTHSTSWLSSSGIFAFGFYSQGGGFSVGIWLMGNPNNAVLWTANRDDPPVTSDAKLELTRDGKLLLTTEHGEEKLVANASASASYASMLDSGNFVLYNEDSEVIWDSFDSPTDTLLGGQKLFGGGELFSSLSETSSATGAFHLKMQHDGNLVLYPTNTGDTPGDSYWSYKTIVAAGSVDYNLYLNSTGVLAIVNGINMLSVGTIYEPNALANNDERIIYRATLDVDGIFRLYSHLYSGNGESKTSKKEWEALTDLCRVITFCGFNSYCTYNDTQPLCLCLPGTYYVNADQTSHGCNRNFAPEGCRAGKDNMASYNISSIENLLWGDRAYFEAEISEDDCKNSCLEDCNCEAALFKGGFCRKQKLPLRYARRDVSESSKAFLKVGKSRNETYAVVKPPVVKITSSKAVVVILVVTIGFIASSCAALAVSGLFVYKFRVLRYERLLQHGSLGVTEELTLRSFSYNELRRATNGFKEELGKGSFGAVYKGVLYRGKKQVAVKRLEKMVEEGEREFRAEMRAIGRTHHKNLVRLLGYCAEDSKRLLVYEYMSNGSLADLIFRAERRPDWDERVRIAVDIARGILYLHEGCEAPIIHCDIKPQNILMDDSWTAKISDFGLAKLLMPDQTRTFTGARGTRGYLAPEWQKNTPISVKADVYSYGIALLEVVCCRRNMEVHLSETDEIVLSNWVCKCFFGRQLNKLVRGEDVDMKTFENMVKVGVWCIQDEPVLRPSMKTVVLMLEGVTHVPVPPCPTANSM